MEHIPTFPTIHLEAVATVSLAPQLEKGTAAVTKRVFVGILPGWGLIFKRTKRLGPAGLIHYSAVQPENGLHLSQQGAHRPAVQME